MRPLTPQLCTGRVFHRRLHPTVHEFVYPVSYVLFDPDRPQDLTDRHRLWSTERWAPVQVRAEDYGSTADAVRRQLREALAVPVLAVGRHMPALIDDGAPVRLLTQPRRWGWLFNPISVYFVWPGNKTSCKSTTESETMEAPVGVVLEVTNTPWKERHQYPVALRRVCSPEADAISLQAEFDKTLHVSPFLDEDYLYRLTTTWQPAEGQDQDTGRSGRLTVGIDAVDDDGRTIVETQVELTLASATGPRMGTSLRRDGFPTHRTSFGIHRQALSLLAKRVPFVAHPRSRRAD